MLATEIPQAAAVSSEAGLLNGLLARAAADDHAAFRALYERSAGRLFAVCLRIARDRSLAEEIVQEAYVRIWERARQFDPARGNALAWMVAVARNHAIDLVRLRARELGSPDELLANAADPAALSVIETRIELRGVQRCLAALDEKVRRAIVLAYRDGLSYEELAAVLDVPVGTAKTWVSRGLSRIRDCLDSP